jgi:hypothetical protein
MRSGSWNVSSLYRLGSLTLVTVLTKCRLDLVGIQVKWEQGGTEPVGDCTFFMEKQIKIIN